MEPPSVSQSGAISGASPRVALLCAALGFAVVLAWQLAIVRTSGLIDDGGITLRYAERIATGQGFNYDASSSVNGASNPLQTLLLAGLLALGVEPWNAVWGLGVVALAGAAGLLAHAFARTSGAAVALFAVAALGTNMFLTSLAVSGMESAVTVLLAAALVHACTTRSETWAGVALGLLVANKVDGGAAALAFAGAVLLLERRFPLRAAAVATAVAAPMFALILINFGTLVPGAAATKIALHESTQFDRTWVVDGLLIHARAARLPHLALLSAVLLLLPRCRNRLLVTLWIWLVVHVGAYSAVDLGDPYPWYLATPVALLIPLVAVLLGHLLELALAPLPAGRRSLAGLLLVAAASGLAFRNSVANLAGPSRAGHDLHPGLISDLGRQSVGAWLRANTSGTERFETPFGLPAFEYAGPVYDPTGLNGPIDADRGASCAYSIVEVSGDRPGPFVGTRRLVAFFRLGADSLGYGLYAAAGSELLESGASHLSLDGTPSAVALDPQSLRAVSPRARRFIAEYRRAMESGDAPDWARAF